MLFEEQRAGRPLPNLTAFSPDMDLGEAYRIQRFLVELLAGDAGPVGYKSALMSFPDQYRMQVPEPILGAIPPDADLGDARCISLAQYPGLKIDVTIGFVIHSLVEAPLADTLATSAVIREIVPVVELPSFHFESPLTVNGRDLVAANLGTRLYIRGAPLDSTVPGAVNGIFIELARNGVVIDRGKAANSMGDQFEALRWLINRILADGGHIDPGQLVLTGALGHGVPAEPGRYRASFRGAGIVEFEIAP